MIKVFGSINLDLIARVLTLPSPGQTVAGVGYTTSPGGKGANQALAARRAGESVEMVGCVGNDANSSAAMELLEKADVNLQAVQTIPDAPTGVALILVDTVSGENQIAVVPGANALVSREYSTGQIIEAEDIVLLQMEIPAETNAAVLEKTKTAGALSLLNIAPYAEEAIHLADLADIIIANETEFDLFADAMGLSGAKRLDRARDYCQRTLKTLIITLGADGAIAVTSTDMGQVSAPAIEAIDTVGAGDTFCGALAVALSERRDMSQALEFACAAGALACLMEGAQPSIPTREMIDTFLAEQP